MGKEEIKVSVIIPIYNVEKYIEPCLESAREQSLKEIEIICVNDGSPDKSMDMVKKAAETDGRIRILEKENGGLSSARNAGLRIAGGKYVLFLDGDDVLKPNALEELYHHMTEYHLQQLFFEAEVIYDTPKVKRQNYKKYHTYYRRKQEYPMPLQGKEMLRKLMQNKEYRMSACLQMFERKFLVENGLEFWEGIIQEDNLFTPQALWAAKRVMVLKEALYIRRLHDSSIMMSKRPADSSWGYYVCMRELQKLIAKENGQEEAVNCLKELMAQLLQQAAGAVCDCEKAQIINALSGKVSEEGLPEYIKDVWESGYMAYRKSIQGRLRYWLIKKMRLG